MVLGVPSTPMPLGGTWHRCQCGALNAGSELGASLKSHPAAPWLHGAQLGVGSAAAHPGETEVLGHKMGTWVPRWRDARSGNVVRGVGLCFWVLPCQWIVMKMSPWWVFYRILSLDAFCQEPSLLLPMALLLSGFPLVCRGSGIPVPAPPGAFCSRFIPLASQPSSPLPWARQRGFAASVAGSALRCSRNPTWKSRWEEYGAGLTARKICVSIKIIYSFWSCSALTAYSALTLPRN